MHLRLTQSSDTCCCSTSLWSCLYEDQHNSGSPIPYITCDIPYNRIGIRSRTHRTYCGSQNPQRLANLFCQHGLDGGSLGCALFRPRLCNGRPRLVSSLCWVDPRTDECRLWTRRTPSRMDTHPQSRQLLHVSLFSFPSHQIPKLTHWAVHVFSFSSCSLHQPSSFQSCRLRLPQP